MVGRRFTKAVTAEVEARKKPVSPTYVRLQAGDEFSLKGSSAKYRFVSATLDANGEPIEVTAVGPLAKANGGHNLRTFRAERVRMPHQSTLDKQRKARA